MPRLFEKMWGFLSRHTDALQCDSGKDADAEGELATQNAEGSRSHPEVAVGSLPSSSCRRAHAGPDSARPPSMPECLWSGHLRHNDAGVDHTLVKFSWCAPSAIPRQIGTWCGCDSRASHPKQRQNYGSVSALADSSSSCVPHAVDGKLGSAHDNCGT